MSSPLIQRLQEQLGYAMIGSDTLAAFLRKHENVVLFFTEDPNRFPESNDVAVILPELVKAFNLTPAIVARSDEKALQREYDFVVWPALVFIHQGQHRGTLTRIRDWADYLAEIPKLLSADTASDVVD